MKLIDSKWLTVSVGIAYNPGQAYDNGGVDD